MTSDRVVKRAADNYEPSLIAKYAISLAQTFNKYYALLHSSGRKPTGATAVWLSATQQLLFSKKLCVC